MTAGEPREAVLVKIGLSICHAHHVGLFVLSTTSVHSFIYMRVQALATQNAISIKGLHF